jgi:hypothetical protein
VADLVHGNRGRAAHNSVIAAIAARVVELAKDKYRGFNQLHLTELLAENEGIALSRPSVRRVPLQAGISSPRRRRAPKHRRRRDRYAREGMLLQMDASRHDWLESRGPYLSLVGAIDDATGKVPWACFREGAVVWLTDGQSGNQTRRSVPTSSTSPRVTVYVPAAVTLTDRSQGFGLTLNLDDPLIRSMELVPAPSQRPSESPPAHFQARARRYTPM